MCVNVKKTNVAFGMYMKSEKNPIKKSRTVEVKRFSDAFDNLLNPKYLHEILAERFVFFNKVSFITGKEIKLLFIATD